MPATTTAPPDFQQALSDTMDDAVPRVLGGESLESFCNWYSAALQPHMDTIAQANVGGADLPRRMVLAMARKLWSSVPLPALRFRPQALPKVERNARCYCGSGRKFKQCCADVADLPDLLEPGHALALALTAMPTLQITSTQLRQMAPDALADAAWRIQQDKGPAALVQLLEPLFLDTAGLDARHEEAFDLLMDALRALGEETRRDKLARAVAACSDKALATSARCRLVTMLADRGEFETAWKLFQETQRFNPDDPQLLHLEMVTLLGQGRADDASLRGPVLAARARKLGYDELAGVLLDLGQHGLAAAYTQSLDDEELDDEEQRWIDLLQAAPAGVDEALCRSLHLVERLPPMEGDDLAVLGIAPAKALAGLERRWRKLFPVETPMMIDLDGDAGAILDEPQAVQAFLAKNPTAWLSVQVLNDLLIAARQMEDETDALSVLVAARALATHAVAVCRALVQGDPCRVLWGMQESRAFLRCIAQSIEFARQMGDHEGAELLIRWMLALNPNDNHGWRDLLVQRCLETGRAEEALQWLDRYPDDIAPAGHNRALALFVLGQPAQAEQVVRGEHAGAPNMVAALLPDVLDQPEDEGGPGLVAGGAMEAFYYREATRPTWVRSGALAWLRGLKLPAPARKPASRAKSAKPLRGGDSPGARPKAHPAAGLALQLAAADRFSTTQGKRLQAAFPDYERLCGYITAIAWSPDIVMPSFWLAPVMAMYQSADPAGSEPPSLDKMNAVLGDLMQLYNHLNTDVLTQDPLREPPVDILHPARNADPAPPDAALLAWAAGFVQGAEQCAAQWRKAGHAVKTDKMPFKALYALAAQAPAMGEAWRPTNDDGQVLLAGIELDPLPVRETLAAALRTLWRTTAPLRQRRMAG